MHLALIFSFVAMGFLGSWHCAVMCGPLSCNYRLKNDFVTYHIGRLFSYLTIGFLLFKLTHYFLDVDSRPLKIIATILYGVLFVIFGLVQLGHLNNKSLSFKYSALPYKFITRFKEPSRKFPIVLGLISGLFPCSWLYSFLFLSTQMKSLTHALLVIFIFWVTALPAFVVFAGFMQGLIKSSPISYKVISGLILIVAGVFSIVGHWI